MVRCLVLAAALIVCSCGLYGQSIEFESGGLKFQTLSKEGVTVMFARLPAQLRNYEILQLMVSNGSGSAVTVKPDDIVFRRQDGTAVWAAPARLVINKLLESASRNDVIRLTTAYEASLFGIPRVRSTNGYEQRRQSFLAEMGSNKLHAAAAASAIAFVTTRLASGETTDGAVFFPTVGKPLGAGKLTVRAANNTFEFETDPEATTKPLRRRPE
ncbi:MAG TPA: hypothetical protein VN428_08735 [Bryobacteraceae bacterium]|nr:hypothetical protein [Bryobacteraceae bacterium]